MNFKASIPIILILTLVFSMTACGRDPQLALFRKDMDAFCTSISEIDAAINSIDASDANAASELLEYLDELDSMFQAFAQKDFPEEFDYLESLADESSTYMTEAVNSYHNAFSNRSYDEVKAEYAKENYSRAYKRLQIIISLLQGKEPEGVIVTTTSSAES